MIALNRGSASLDLLDCADVKATTDALTVAAKQAHACLLQTAKPPTIQQEITTLKAELAEKDQLLAKYQAAVASWQQQFAELAKSNDEVLKDVQFQKSTS